MFGVGSQLLQVCPCSFHRPRASSLPLLLIQAQSFLSETKGIILFAHQLHCKVFFFLLKALSLNHFSLCPCGLDDLIWAPGLGICTPVTVKCMCSLMSLAAYSPLSVSVSSCKWQKWPCCLFFQICSCYRLAVPLLTLSPFSLSPAPLYQEVHLTLLQNVKPCNRFLLLLLSPTQMNVTAGLCYTSRSQSVIVLTPLCPPSHGSQEQIWLLKHFAARPLTHPSCLKSLRILVLKYKLSG